MSAEQESARGGLFVVVVWFDLVPEHKVAFARAMIENAAASLKEPGCRQFDVCFREEGRSCFLYELYDDRAAFAAHKRTPHFLHFDAVSKPHVISKRVETYDRAFPAKGALR